MVCDNQEKRVSAVGKRKLGWYNSCKNKPKEEEQRCSQNPISRTESAINPMLTADWNFTAAKAGKIGDLSTISMHKETI